MNFPNPLIEIVQLSFRYPGQEDWVLEGVNCQIPRDAHTAIVGPSGCGKTTLLKLMSMQEDTPKNVLIYYNGTNYTEIGRSKRIAMRKAEFGFVLQDSYLLPNLTCRENLQIPLLLNGLTRKEARQVVDEVAEKVHLNSPLHSNGATETRRSMKSPLDSYPNEVSGGQRRRVAFLRSLIHDPAIVFADEPFTGLDSRLVSQCMELLNVWRSGQLKRVERDARTLVMITHDRSLADRHADQVISMRPWYEAGSSQIETICETV